MSAPVVEAGEAFNLTATGNVGAAGRDMTMIGFYVNSTSSGTLVFRRGGSGGTAMTGTITPSVGWNYLPVCAPGGLHVTVGGTIDVTVVALAGQA
jgi:hypothetical protein